MTKIANKGFRGAFESKRLFGPIPNYRTSPSLPNLRAPDQWREAKIASEDAFDRGTRIAALDAARKPPGEARLRRRADLLTHGTERNLPRKRQPHGYARMWHYHYRGISAPTGSGSQEAFDLGMFISRVTRNVEAQGPGMAKTLGPKET